MLSDFVDGVTGDGLAGNVARSWPYSPSSILALLVLTPRQKNAGGPRHLTAVPVHRKYGQERGSPVESAGTALRSPAVFAFWNDPQRNQLHSMSCPVHNRSAKSISPSRATVRPSERHSTPRVRHLWAPLLSCVPWAIPVMESPFSRYAAPQNFQVPLFPPALGVPT